MSSRPSRRRSGGILPFALEVVFIALWGNFGVFVEGGGQVGPLCGACLRWLCAGPVSVLKIPRLRFAALGMTQRLHFVPLGMTMRFAALGMTKGA